MVLNNSLGDESIILLVECLASIHKILCSIPVSCEPHLEAYIYNPST